MAGKNARNVTESSRSEASARPAQRSSIVRVMGASWNHYTHLRNRADENSVSWWELAIFKALFLWALLVIVGLGILVLVHSELSLIGLGIIFFALLLLLRAIAAPWTYNWVVDAPADWYYYVVERHDKRVICFVKGGVKTIVPWFWNTNVIPFADFNFVPIEVEIPNVMIMSRISVNVTISAAMRFDPTQAKPENLPMLRRMNEQKAYANMLAGLVKTQARKYLTTVGTQSGLNALQIDDVSKLEAILQKYLTGLNEMGLLLIVDVVVSDAIRPSQDMMRRLDRAHVSDDIENLAAKLNVSAEEAAQIYAKRYPGATSRPRGSARSPIVVVGDTDKSQESPVPSPAPAPVSPAPEPASTQPPAAEKDSAYAPPPGYLNYPLDEQQGTQAGPGASRDAAQTMLDQDYVPDPMDTRRKLREAASAGSHDIPDQQERKPDAPDPMRDVRQIMQSQGYEPDPWYTRHQAKLSRLRKR